MSAVRQPRPPRSEPSWSAAQLRRWARDELAEQLDHIAATELRTAELLRARAYRDAARSYQARADAAAELARGIRAEPAWWDAPPTLALAGDEESECA